MSGLVALLSKSVDYAGLFPPAALDIDSVVSNYSEYLTSSQRWMLARLIIPAMRLSEFRESAKEFLPSGDPPWLISALVPEITDTQKFSAAIQNINAFNSQSMNQKSAGAIVDAIETKANSKSQIESIAKSVPDGMDVFIEIPHGNDPESLIEFLSQVEQGNETKIFAKIRTGGVTSELIPSTAEVARFIATCVDHDVGFKATAGLHHPLRNEFPLNYEEDSPRAILHGFINVFVAACMAWKHRLDESTIEQILNDNNRSDFGFDDGQIQWRRYSMTSGEVASVRAEKIASFGSCSFVEPVQDLRSLGFGAALAEVASQET